VASAARSSGQCLGDVSALRSVAGGLAQPILFTRAVPARHTLAECLSGVSEGVSAPAFGSGTLDQG
jgi:hypothetical protein